MGLRARLALIVVMGLVLMAAGAVYLGAAPWQTARAAGGGEKLIMSAQGDSCTAGVEGASCSAKSEGGVSKWSCADTKTEGKPTTAQGQTGCALSEAGCSDGGGCAMEKAPGKPVTTESAKPTTAPKQLTESKAVDGK